ncbi:hypothetical protein ACWC0A_30980 [Streptomyces scopuliridis]
MKSLPPNRKAEGPSPNVPPDTPASVLCVDLRKVTTEERLRLLASGRGARGRAR